MNWNPYKRIAELEAMHTENIAVLDTLASKLNSLRDRHDALSRWMVKIEDRLQEMDKRLNPYAAAPVRSEGEPVFAEAEVASEAEQRRLKRREYQRAWYSKQKAKAKQREWNAAYRARKKAEKAAAQAVGGTA
jgi:chromosome segregation ATPase